MSGYAYWITPKGKIISPESRHIISVVKYPKKFGETDKTIDDTFNKYGEQKLSDIEGEAREEIMLRVIKRGYIRVRNNNTRNSQHWSIQLNKLTNKVNDILWEWANKIIREKTSLGRYSSVIIHELGRNDKLTQTTLDKIASGKSIRERKGYLTNDEVDEIRIYKENELYLIEDWNDIDSKQMNENSTTFKYLKTK